MPLLTVQQKRQFDQQFERIRSLDPTSVVPESERHRLTIKDVKFGGVLKMDERHFMVTSIGRYTEMTDESYSKATAWQWFELKLFCLETAEIKFLEWEEDDEIEISTTIEKVDFQNLKDDMDDAIDEDDLEEIVDKRESILYGGTTYAYSNDYPVTFQRDVNDSKSEKLNVYFYSFKANETEQLTIEEWQLGGDKYSYDVFISRAVDPNSIEVLVKGK